MAEFTNHCGNFAFYNATHRLFSYPSRLKRNLFFTYFLLYMAAGRQDGRAAGQPAAERQDGQKFQSVRCMPPVWRPVEEVTFSLTSKPKCVSVYQVCTIY